MHQLNSKTNCRKYGWINFRHMQVFIHEDARCNNKETNRQQANYMVNVGALHKINKLNKTKKTKRLRVRDSPCGCPLLTAPEKGCWWGKESKCFSSSAKALEKGLMTMLGAPRGGCDVAQQQFSLNMKPRLNRNRRRKKSWKVWLLAGHTTGVNNERGTCTQLKHFALPQRNSQVVNLTSLC